jgi:hypothetical protein
MESSNHAMAHDNYVYDYPQGGSNTTPRGLKGRRPVIFNNIHVKQDASIHGQAYVFTVMFQKQNMFFD